MARRRSVPRTFLVLVKRLPMPDRRRASGRTVRSKKGCWSSSSSRVRACIAPSWVRRAWTGSAPPRPRSTTTTSRMPTPAMSARMRVGFMTLHLDVDDAADEQEPDEHHDAAQGEHAYAERQPERLGRLLEHGPHELGGDGRDDAQQADGQEADDVAGHASLRREGPDLALDAHALPDGERDGVEDLCEVAAHLVLDVDGRGHQVEVIGADAPREVGECLVEGQAEVDLAHHPVEL